MIELIVLADDLTGALDTGVQFAKAGISTEVVTIQNLLANDIENPPRVLVIDLESRHLTPKLAKHLAKTASSYPGKYYYKKTDSGMRGNIGAELEGLLCANPGESIVFVPAFPEVGRTTLEGIHYANGIPISKSVFGADSFEPVKKDYIPDIIALQSYKTVAVVSSDKIKDLKKLCKENDILVFDAADSTAMEQIAEEITCSGPPKLMAGCAGFAQYLPHILRLKGAPCQKRRFAHSGIIVLSGSINWITMQQVLHAQKAGFTVIEPTPEEKISKYLTTTPLGESFLSQITDAYKKSHRVIIQSSMSLEHIQETDQLAKLQGLDRSQTMQRIAANLGSIAAKLIQSNICDTLIVFGGDTLIAVTETVGGGRLVPIEEIASGVVLSTIFCKGKHINLVTKSGGLGNENILTFIESYLNPL